MSNILVGRPMEILLIEDNLADARLTCEALKEGNFRHRLTSILDGEEAMRFLNRDKEFARAPRPDLILLDLGLPKMDGRAVLREIKGDPELRSIPVVVMTASKDHEDAVCSQLLNVNAYITKPVDMEKFLGLVKQLKSFWHADVVLPTA